MVKPRETEMQILHQFRDTLPGEGETRVQMARMPGEDFVAVAYDDSARGWIAKVYRCTLGGTVMAAKAWGEPHPRRKDAIAEADASGIPYMPKFYR